MCYLSSAHKKHLIVTHEKGKSSHFTILQLNALLKQDSNKRNKLTSQSVTRGVVEEGIILVPPINGVKGETILFKVPTDGFSNYTFLDTYHLQGVLDFKVKYQEYTDDTYTTKKKANVTEEDFLRPEKHGFSLPTSSGLLALFKRAEVSFDTYTDQLSSFSGGSLNWINRLSTLETGFSADSTTNEELSEYGLIPAFNRNLVDLTNLMGGSVSELWPDNDASTGGRTFYARLNVFPFRVFPPWQNQRIKKNLGPNLVNRNGALIPKQVQLNLKLEVEKTIPAMYRFTVPLQEHSLVSKEDPTAEEKMSWQRFTLREKDDPTKIVYCQMIEIVPELMDLHLVIRKIRELSPRIETHFTQFYSVYRTSLHQLENASQQIHYLSWDIENQPSTLFLSFIRDA